MVDIEVEEELGTIRMEEEVDIVVEGEVDRFVEAVIHIVVEKEVDAIVETVAEDEVDIIVNKVDIVVDAEEIVAFL